MPPAISHLSDAELVVRCRLGNQPAWNLLVERFGGYVDAIARRGYRLNDADAEDVFQDVFIRTYQGLDRLRDNDAIRPWIAQLTRRLCVDRLRAAKRESTNPDCAGDETPHTHEERLARIDEAIVVHYAMITLPDQTREILERFFLQDQSYRTIALQMNLPPGTIASRIARGLTRLRIELEPQDAPRHPSPLPPERRTTPRWEDQVPVVRLIKDDRRVAGAP
jgi:RNA polymerase sigma-70 factor (ECF subfamily)